MTNTDIAFILLEKMICGGIVSAFIPAVCSVLWLVFAALLSLLQGLPAELLRRMRDMCCENETKGEQNRTKHNTVIQTRTAWKEGITVDTFLCLHTDGFTCYMHLFL